MSDDAEVLCGTYRTTDVSYYDVCVCTIIAGWFYECYCGCASQSQWFGACRVYDWQAVLSVTGQQDTVRLDFFEARAHPLSDINSMMFVMFRLLMTHAIVILFS